MVFLDKLSQCAKYVSGGRKIWQEWERRKTRGDNLEENGL
jgi:hypothetical protein